MTFKRMASVGALLTALLLVASRGRVGAATFNVNSTADAADWNAGDGVCETAAGTGECTVRAALGEAQALTGEAHLINVPAGTYTLSLANDLDFHGEISLLGAGSASTIFDAAGGSSVIRIHTDSDLAHIAGVKLIGGDPFGIFDTASGGAVLELDDVIIDGAAGPGLSSSGDGSVLLSDCQVSNNLDSGITLSGGISMQLVRTTVNDNVTDFLGGGIESLGELVLVDSEVIGNESMAGTGAGSGGGISNGGTLVVRGGSISGNIAAAKGGGLYSSGPAVLLDCVVGQNAAGTSGGGVHNESSYLEVVGCVLSQNSSTSVGGAVSTGALGAASATRLVDSWIEGNTAGAAGGGVYNSGDLAGASTRVERSTLSGNMADTGAGLHDGGGSVQLLNVTVSGNTATSSGGGVGGASSSSSISIWYSTLFQNAAPSGSAIASSGGTVELAASIVAGDPANNCASTLPTSLGYNLEDGTGCGLSAAGDLSAASPGLGALGADKGTVPVHAPTPRSAAIDAAGDVDTCLGPSGVVVGSDGRFYRRPVDGNGDHVQECDIGAVEYLASPLDPIFFHDFESGTLLGWSAAACGGC